MWQSRSCQPPTNAITDRSLSSKREILLSGMRFQLHRRQPDSAAAAAAHAAVPPEVHLLFVWCAIALDMRMSMRLWCGRHPNVGRPYYCIGILRGHRGILGQLAMNLQSDMHGGRALDKHSTIQSTAAPPTIPVAPLSTNRPKARYVPVPIGCAEPVTRCARLPDPTTAPVLHAPWCH